MSARKESTKNQDKEKIQSLIDKVKSIWPDLEINGTILQKLTSDFVYEFYSRFYLEYEQNLSRIECNILKRVPEQVPSSLNAAMDDITLTIKLRQLCSKLNINPFYLTDICEPQPKRTVLYFTIFVNLLIYFKSNTNFVDELTEVMRENENFQKVYNRKQTLLEEMQHLTLLQVKKEDDIKKLTQDLENLSGEHKVVLSQGSENEFEYQEDIKIRDKLKENIKSSDEKLSALHKEYTLLQEQVVAVADVENLKIVISSLEKELEILNTDHSSMVTTLEQQEKVINCLHECLEVLQNRDFDMEHLKTLRNLMNDYFDTNQEIKNIKEEMSNQRIEFECLKKEEMGLKDEILVLEKKFGDLKNITEMKILEVNQKFNVLSANVRIDIHACKNYTDDILQFKKLISDAREDMVLLKAGVEEEFNKLVQKQALIYNRFNEALVNIDKNQREH